MPTHIARVALVVCVLLFVPRIMAAPPVHPRFELTSPDSGPFPSDRFTIRDRANRTGLRVDLPMPDCVERPSDCEDVAVLNTLDGFNVQPRLSIPFDGGIDVQSVTSDTVFLLKLGCAHDNGSCDEDPSPERIGIDQVVWDTFTNTLHVESDQLLDQHTRYALIVTRKVRDSFGGPIAAPASFQRFRQTVGDAYKQALLEAERAARQVGVAEDHIAVASVFTTQSVTALMEKIRDQIKRGPVGITDFALGAKGARTVFPLEEVTSVSWTQQTRTAPAFNTVTFTLADLRAVPGAVGQIAFGRFPSRDYQVHPGDVIPPVGTRRGTPAVFGTHDIYFNSSSPRARRQQTAGRSRSSEPWAAAARKASRLASPVPLP
jgi:Bacterial virulence factor lipase N-terminal